MEQADRKQPPSEARRKAMERQKELQAKEQAPPADHRQAVLDAVSKRGKPGALVSLADLHKEVGGTLEDLHATVNDLRRQQKLTGTAHESRSGIPAGMKAAAINEASGPIHHVSLKEEEPAAPPAPKAAAAQARFDNRAAHVKGGGLFGGEDLQARAGFARLPHGAPILFTEGEFAGKTGKVVRDTDPAGKPRIVAVVDGREGMVPISPEAIEPLHAHHSWRTEQGASAAGMKQADLMGSAGYHRRELSTDPEAMPPDDDDDGTTLGTTAFDPDKHPRGQPGNPGQFGPGGSGGAATKDKPKPEKEKEDEPFVWDGVIDQDEVERSRSADYLTTWNFSNDGKNFRQEIYIREGEYDPNPGVDDGHETETVYRWESRQEGAGLIEEGKWTADRDEAERDGRNYAEEHNEDKVEPEEEEDEDEDDDEDDEYGVDSSRPTGAQRAWSKLFDSVDNPPDFDEAAELVGAPDGARTRVTVDDNGDIEINVTHPKIESCQRTFQTNRSGDVFCHNDLFVLKKEHRGDGLGLEVFSGQVEACAKAGVAYIETHAAQGGDYNGYYTWPLFGYDEDVSSIARDRPRLAARIAETFPDAESVLDIYATAVVELTEEAAAHVRTELAKLDRKLGKPAKERGKISGRDWWKIHGGPLHRAKFDLADGSRSQQTLARYKKAKG